jgi:hypothetical protein
MAIKVYRGTDREETFWFPGGRENTLSNAAANFVKEFTTDPDFMARFKSVKGVK